MSRDRIADVEESDYGEGRYDPVEERPYGDDEDGRRFPFVPTWGWPSLGWRPLGKNEAGAPEEEYGEQPYEAEARDRGRFWGLWDEGLITLLIVGGAILFLFPEPATSGLGVLLMGIGVFAWLIDWAT